MGLEPWKPVVMSDLEPVKLVVPSPRNSLREALDRHILTGEIANSSIAPEVTPLLVLDPAQEGRVLKSFEVFDLHARDDYKVFEIVYTRQK